MPFDGIGLCEKKKKRSYKNNNCNNTPTYTEKTII